MKPRQKERPRDDLNKMSSNNGVLYICPTPIGNLEDITLRCLRVLKDVDLIAAEDTRMTQKLLNHYDIKTPMVSYHKFSDKNKTDNLLDKIIEGNNIALVTDAGTPLISDPGNEIVFEAIIRNIIIVPLPGPSAVTCALSASGLVSAGYIFYGFLPKKNNEKKIILQSLVENQMPIVLFESPKRLMATLCSIYDYLGDVNVLIAREITKIYEEFLFKSVKEHIEYFKTYEPKGEITLIIDVINKEKSQLTEQELKTLIIERINCNHSISDIAKELSKDLSLKKKDIYKLALDVKEDINK